MSDDESYRQLGLAVIIQAARDMKDGLGQVSATARVFLRGSPEFFFWAAVAEVSAERVRNNIFSIIDGAASRGTKGPLEPPAEDMIA